jgi:hypothetical protein
MRHDKVVGIVAVLLLALTAPGVAAAQPSPRAPERPVVAGPGDDQGRFATESRRLADGLVDAVTSAGWDDLVDYSVRVGGVAQPIRALPNVDVAVIELDSTGHVVGAANVLLDRDKPDGYRVSLDPRTLAPRGVEFTQWRTARWNTQDAWDAGPAADDVLAGAGSDVEFMVPYPASVLKVMVAYAIVRLVDDGSITLDTEHTYRRVDGRGCEVDGRTRTIAEWMDGMITVSGNGPTCALLQVLEDLGELDAANDHFAELGLETLRMFPAQRDVGAVWLDAPARMTMGAMDTAKLLLLVSGSTRNLWRGPDGRPVRADVLSADSRAFLEGLLLEQGFHEVLSTGLLCGSEDTVAGIPALVPARFIAPNGHGIVAGIDFGYDVRPCNATAEVTFAHKTGLISVAGNDAGIVRALPGEDGRWYVVAINASVGTRFGDAAWARSSPNACDGAPFVCYPPAFARTGAAIDQLVVDRPRNVR